MQVLIMFVSFLSMVLAGCGQLEGHHKGASSDGTAATKSVSNTPPKIAAKYVDSTTDLPACNPTTSGELIYIAESSTFEYCDSTDWAPVVLQTPAAPAPAMPPIIITISYHLGTAAAGGTTILDFQAMEFIPVQNSVFQLSQDDFTAAVQSNLQCLLTSVNSTIYSCGYLETNANCQTANGEITCTVPTITAKGDSF